MREGVQLVGRPSDIHLLLRDGPGADSSLVVAADVMLT